MELAPTWKVLKILHPETTQSDYNNRCFLNFVECPLTVRLQDV